MKPGFFGISNSGQTGLKGKVISNVNIEYPHCAILNSKCLANFQYISIFNSKNRAVL